jgi:hypothetical protein
VGESCCGCKGPARTSRWNSAGSGKFAWP